MSTGKLQHLGPRKPIDISEVEFHLHHDDVIAAPGRPQHWRGVCTFPDGTTKEYGFSLQSGNNAFASATLRGLLEHDIRKGNVRFGTVPKTPTADEQMGEPVEVDEAEFREI